MKNFEGKTVVVTGGSRGIGRAAAELFAEQGAKVIILASSKASSKDVLDSISASGGDARAFSVDVSSLSEVEAVGKEIFEAYGKVDILVNNAGITADSSLKKMTEEQFDRVIAVNLKGAFNCTKVFGLHMAQNGGGSVTNVSSVVAHYGNFGQTNYVASKTGLIGMTKTWARELGPKGVRVNAVAPGFVETDMIKSVPKATIEALQSQVPLKRFAKAKDIASTYLFLASAAASYINGAVINVDGGLVL